MVPSQQSHVARLLGRRGRQLLELLRPLREELELLSEVGDLARLCRGLRGGLGGCGGCVGHDSSAYEHWRDVRVDESAVDGGKGSDEAR